MSTFTKIYKKVANNGNEADYQVVGQVGVNGVPLDIMHPCTDAEDGEIGLVPKPLKGGKFGVLSANGNFRTPNITQGIEGNLYCLYLNLDDELISKLILPEATATDSGIMSSSDKAKLDNFMKITTANADDNFVNGTTYLPNDKSEVILDEFYLVPGHLYIYQSQMTVDGSASSNTEFLHYRHTGDEYINDFHNFLDSYALSVSGAYYNTITLTSFIDLRSASKQYTFGANSWSTIGRKCAWSRKIKIIL